MTLKLSGYLFTGPFPIDKTIIRANQPPVVFIVIAKGGPGWAPTFRVIDVGYTEESGITFADHPALTQWTAASDSVPGLYFFYTPKSQFSTTDRQKIADDLRQKYNPPDGLVEG